MLKKIFIVLGFMLVSAVLMNGCSQNPIAVTVKPGEVFTIGVGTTARISGENMTITFNSVINDSRAPQNVQAIWAGEATSNVTITYLGVQYPVVLRQSGGTEQATQPFLNYTLTSILSPYPVAGEEIPPKNYRLTMTVTNSTSIPPPGPGPSGVPIVDNGAIITGEVKSVTSLSSRPVWAVEILVQSVQNLDNMPNVAAGKEGQTLVMQTPQDVSDLKAGQIVTATVKLSGDEFGTFFYTPNITRQ